MSITRFRSHRSLTALLSLILPLVAACKVGAVDTEESSLQGSQGSLTSTSTSSGGDHQPSSEELYSASVKRVTMEVDYAKGAEPYTGNLTLFGDTWGVFKTNAERLFQGSGKELTIPTELSDMQELTDISGTEFTGEKVLEIAASHRDMLNSGDTATFYFVWLPGYYHDGAGVRKDVLGVSFGGTGVIAMFKPVIAGAGPGLGNNIEKYVEQATLVHEFGHAIGLVNNGLPLMSQHHDEPHGAHCTNTDCVMYYAIEGTAGAVEFAQKYISNQDSILFAEDCLADVDSIIKKNGGT